MIAIGNTSRRAEMARRKVTLICAVIGAVVIAVAGTLITYSCSNLVLYSSEAATVILYNPRASSARHLPSTPSTLLATAT